MTHECSAIAMATWNDILTRNNALCVVTPLAVSAVGLHSMAYAITKQCCMMHEFAALYSVALGMQLCYRQVLVALGAACLMMLLL